jgi:Mrp family chromosome partitioning ATPase
VIAAVPEGAVLAIAPLGATEMDRAADIALALARSLAAAGYRVVLADAAIVAPRVGPLLEMAGSTGLSDVLAAASGAPEPVEVDGVRVLPAGLRINQARERYGGAAMAALLAGLRADADYVLVVTPAVDSSDGAAVLPAIERVVLVATESVTRRAQVSEAAQLADRFARPLVGLVAVRAGRERPGPRERAPQGTDRTESTDEEEPAASDGRAGAHRMATGRELA